MLRWVVLKPNKYTGLYGEHSATLSIIVAIAKGLNVHPKKLLDFDFDFGDHSNSNQKSTFVSEFY